MQQHLYDQQFLYTQEQESGLYQLSQRPIFLGFLLEYLVKHRYQKYALLAAGKQQGKCLKACMYTCNLVSNSYIQILIVLLPHDLNPDTILQYNIRIVYFRLRNHYYMFIKALSDILFH